jgi:two-component system chemotaxis response regulator CheB
LRRPSRVVAVGASAGGVSAITNLVREFPADLDAAVLVVLHLLPTARSALPEILSRNTDLRVESATDGTPLQAGHVYVAPPDLHLEVDAEHVQVVRGPWENGHRPAVDVLFRSVARWWSSRAIAVVLSGALDDGAAGGVAIDQAGGVVLVQDPEEATVPDMPLAVIETGVTKNAMPTAQLAAHITRMCREPTPSTPVPEVLIGEVDDIVGPAGDEQPARDDGTPAGFVCPDCGGSLFEFGDLHYSLRCRVGHAWGPESLHDAHQRRFEEALWTALRIIEENIVLQERMATRASNRQHERLAARIRRRLEERTRVLETLRELVANERGASSVTAASVGGVDAS